MRLALWVILSSAIGCNPRSTDEGCIVYQEACGCDMICGTVRERDRAYKHGVCDIGCLDTGEARPSDQDCVSDGAKACVLLDEGPHRKN
jgi:hypothetical protein